MIAYDCCSLPKELKLSLDERKKLKQQIHVYKSAYVNSNGRIVRLTKDDIPMLEKQNPSASAAR